MEIVSQLVDMNKVLILKKDNSKMICLMAHLDEELNHTPRLSELDGLRVMELNYMVMVLISNFQIQILKIML